MNIYFIFALSYLIVVNKLKLYRSIHYIIIGNKSKMQNPFSTTIPLFRKKIYIEIEKKVVSLRLGSLYDNNINY